jgi:hypothetical protein
MSIEPKRLDDAFKSLCTSLLKNQTETPDIITEKIINIFKTLGESNTKFTINDVQNIVYYTKKFVKNNDITSEKADQLFKSIINCESVVFQEAVINDKMLPILQDMRTIKIHLLLHTENSTEKAPEAPPSEASMQIDQIFQEEKKTIDQLHKEYKDLKKEHKKQEMHRHISMGVGGMCLGAGIGLAFLAPPLLFLAAAGLFILLWNYLTPVRPSKEFVEAETNYDKSAQRLLALKFFKQIPEENLKTFKASIGDKFQKLINSNNIKTLENLLNLQAFQKSHNEQYGKTGSTELTLKILQNINELRLKLDLEEIKNDSII